MPEPIWWEELNRRAEAARASGLRSGSLSFQLAMEYGEVPRSGVAQLSSPGRSYGRGHEVPARRLSDVEKVYVRVRLDAIAAGQSMPLALAMFDARWRQAAQELQARYPGLSEADAWTAAFRVMAEAA